MQYTAPLGPFFSTEYMAVGNNRTVMVFDAQSLVRPTRKAKPPEAAPHNAKQNGSYRE